MKWEYTMLVTRDIRGVLAPEVKEVWTKRNKEGKTDFDKVNEYGADGWELVSNYPVEGPNGTTNLVFVFKRSLG